MTSGKRRTARRRSLGAVAIAGLLSAAPHVSAHETVSGVAIAPAKIDRGWSFQAQGEAVLVPHCNGRERVLVDGVVKDPGSKGPLVVRLGDQERPHDVVVEVKISTYEKRIACSHPPRVGAVIATNDGLQTITFSSPHTAPATGQGKAGEAVLFVPGGHDRLKPSALLVGVHPWNSNPWTYAAYEEL